MNQLIYNPSFSGLSAGNFSVVATLLLPQNYLGAFRQRQQIYGSNTDFLRFLIETYGNSLFSRGRSRKATVNYQDKGLFLEKYNIRVNDDVWIRLKLAALNLGISVTGLVVMLLKMELAGVGEVMREAGFAGVPTIPIILKITRTTENIYNYYYQSGPLSCRGPG